MGLNKTEEIYWKSIHDFSFVATVGDKFSANAIVIKAGYGFKIANRFRITPQAGAQMTLVKSGTSYYADGSKTISAVIAARCIVAVLPWLGVSLTPEYAFRIHETDGYEALRSVSSKVDKWSKGFNIKVGVTFFY